MVSARYQGSDQKRSPTTAWVFTMNAPTLASPAPQASPSLAMARARSSDCKVPTQSRTAASPPALIAAMANSELFSPTTVRLSVAGSAAWAAAASQARRLSQAAGTWSGLASASSFCVALRQAGAWRPRPSSRR